MSLYNQLAEIPVPVSAQFISTPDADTTVVQVTYSVKGHVRNVKRTMSKSIAFSGSGESSVPAATPLQDIDVVAQVVSPSAQKRATLRNVKAADGSSTRIVEVWLDGLLKVSLNVTDIHGDFYTDEFLGSFSFSPSELALVYTAEGKLPEKSPDPYQKFRFNPDFGEGLVGKKRPTTFLLRWEEPPSDSTSPTKTQLTPLQTFHEVRFGQTIFSPNSDNIIYATGYEFTQDGRILGIKGCFNRPSGIWKLRVALPSQISDSDSSPTELEIEQAEKLTPSDLSCRSPRVLKTDETHSTLLWLSSKSSGAHLAASTLHGLDITSDSSHDTVNIHLTRRIVGTVEVPKSNGFPGLYTASYNIPSLFSVNPFKAPHPHIIVGSQWGSRTTVIAISAMNGSVWELTPRDSNLFSWSVLATDGRRRVLCSRSSPSVPYEVLIGTFHDAGEVSWKVVDKPSLAKGVATVLSTVQASIIPIPGRPLVETIVIHSEKDKVQGIIPPCITSPHGGPHGTSSTAFSPTTTALVLEGYTMSLPNYTGSPGYGEKFLQALIGRCGELDVQDCIASSRHLIELGISEAGPGKQLITGGSHGGFLTVHLIGQFPDFFSAAILRNPVVFGEISNTDIPDWYYSEFGLPYPAFSSAPSVYYPSKDAKSSLTLTLSQSEPTPSSSASGSRTGLPPLVTIESFKILQMASPIIYLDAISIPVLLLMGASDRRVAPYHGIEFYHALKARYSLSNGDEKKKKRVEMLVFEGEGHPLDGVEASRVGFEASREWFAEVSEKMEG